jgi:sec-independent protein translocase protein TatC
MLSMSFLDHVQELRSRILKMVLGLLIAGAISLTSVNQLWRLIAAPAVEALTRLGIKPPTLKAIPRWSISTSSGSSCPFCAPLFIAAPWVVYQIWAFISPGLYKRERRYAVPFVLSTAGLFILGGVFAYFVTFRFALTFLLGIGVGNYVDPTVSIGRILRSIRQRDARGGTHLRNARSDFRPHSTSGRQAGIPCKAQPLCDPKYFRHRRHRHPYPRRC